MYQSGLATSRNCAGVSADPWTPRDGHIWLGNCVTFTTFVAIAVLTPIPVFLCYTKNIVAVLVSILIYFVECMLIIAFTDFAKISPANDYKPLP